MKTLWTILLLLLLTSGCMAPYQPIQLPQLATQQRSYRLSDSDIRVTVIQDVFEGKRNQFFARRESRQRINLIGLRIDNETDKPLRIPLDLLFQAQDGSSLLPLPAGEAISLLCEEKDRDPVNVNGARLLFFAGQFGNQLHKAKIKADFADDIMKQYLPDTTLEAGKSLYGLLALPLAPGHHFHLAERQIPSVLEGRQ